MTLSQLTRWIFEGTRQRAPRRRPRPQQFHVERLEARTVLSATIGTLPADSAATGPVAAWESMADDTAWQPQYSVGAAAESHWEDAPTFAFNGPPHDMPRFDRPNPGLAFGGWYGAPTPVRVVYVITITRPDFSAPDKQIPQMESGQQAQSQFNQMGDVPPALRATSPAAAQPNERPDSRPVAFRLPFEAAQSYASLASATSATATATRTASATTLQAYDTAFQDYSTERLLLAATMDADSDADTDADEASDDATDCAEMQSDDLDSLGDAVVADGASESLDVLGRERAAIDAVLAELHELEPGADEHHDDAPTTPAPTTEAPVDEEVAAQTGAQYTPAANDAGEGGMVWLEPTGDANRSAFDLTDVFLSGLQTAPPAAVGMEASLGVYQAFDVGTNEALPAANAAPAATPAAALHPSVSAGRDAAKQVEQPS